MNGAALLGTIAHFLFPITCAVCGRDLARDDRYRVCSDCEKALPRIEGLICLACGKPLPDGGAHCYRCRTSPPSWVASIRSSMKYEGELRRLLHKFKFQNREYLCRFFARLLIETLERQPYKDKIEAVAAVPMHRLKRHFRGYDQSALIATLVAEHIRKPLLVDVLRRRRWTTAQFKLSRREREVNLRDAFYCLPEGSLKKKRVLLIDDICTTGATVEQCARALRRAGVARVYALTVARD